MEKYIEMETFVSNNYIDIKEIGEFETLIKEKNVETIFYGCRTARSKFNPIEGMCFLFVIDSVFYVFTYNSKYGFYKTIHEYKNGVEKNCINAITYYTLLEQNGDQADFNEYLKNEYQVNEIEIMRKEEKINNMENTKNQYFPEYIKMIDELEKIKKKYNFDSAQSIIAYIMLKENKRNIDSSDLMSKCSEGIFISKELSIELKISDSYPPDDSPYRYSDYYIKGFFIKIAKEEKGEYLRDEERFIIKMKEIQFKLGGELVLENNSSENTEYNNIEDDDIIYPDPNYYRGMRRI